MTSVDEQSGRQTEEIVPKDAFSPARTDRHPLMIRFIRSTQCVYVFFLSLFTKGHFVFNKDGDGGSFFAAIRIKWKTGRPGILSNFRCLRCSWTTDAIVLKPKTFIMF